jgi:hypothetical protein
MTAPSFAHHVRLCDGGVETVGLGSLGQQDLRLPCPPWLVDAGLQYAQTLVAYVHDTERRIVAGEKVACGSWMLRFVSARDGKLEAQEADLSSGDYVPGATTALRYWMEQHAICHAAGATFDPFGLNERVAVSNDLRDAAPEAVIEGLRYPSGSGRVALYLLGPAFEGDYDRNVTVHHAYHIMERLPQIVPYLGLPAGYCFFTSGEVRREPGLLDGDADQ